jgi:3-oxoacyl-[acyl-carrier-protein] synthase-1
MVSVLRPFAPAVVAVGARAPLGLSALQLAMCARARRLVPTTTLVSDKRGHLIGACPAWGIPHDLQGYERLLALAAPALREAGGELHTRVPLLLALAEPGRPDDDARIEGALLADLAAQSGVPLDLERSQLFRAGQAGFAAALGEGLRRIRSGEARALLVGGADSYLHPATLAWLDQECRLHAPGAEDGFIPGEGAAFVLLCREPADVASPGKAAPLPFARLLDVELGREETELTGDPNLGTAMTGVLARLGSTLPDGLIDWVLSDVNGERHRLREWTMVQNRGSLRPGATHSRFIDDLGDLGAALGPVLLAIAAHAFRSGSAPAHSAAITLQSEGVERGAFLLEGAEAPPRSERAPRSSAGGDHARSPAARLCSAARDAVEQALLRLPELPPRLDRAPIVAAAEAALGALATLAASDVDDPAHLDQLGAALGALDGLRAEHAEVGGEAAAASRGELERAERALQQSRPATIEAVVAVQEDRHRRASSAGALREAELLASRGVPRLHTLPRAALVPALPYSAPRMDDDDDEPASAPRPALPALGPAADELRACARQCAEDIGLLSMLRGAEGDDPWTPGILRFEQRMLDSLDALASLARPFLVRERDDRWSTKHLDVLAEVERWSADGAVPDASRAFAAAFVLGCVEGEDAVRAAVLLLRNAPPALHPAQAEALILAPSPLIGEAMRRLSTGDDPALARLALDVLHRRRDASFAAAAMLLDHPDAGVRRSAARCLGLAAERAPAAALLAEALTPDEDPLVATAAAESLLLLGAPAGLAYLRKSLRDELSFPDALPDPVRFAQLRLLALAGGQADGELLLRSFRGHPEEVRAMGWFGHAGLVEPLLEALERGNQSSPDALSPLEIEAARAIQRITGAPLFHPPSDDADAAEVGTIITEAAAWKAWWAEHRGAFGGHKYRFGQPFSSLASLAELAGEGVATSVRVDCAFELALLSGGAIPLLDVHDWTARQAERLGALQASLPKDRRGRPLLGTPGEWPDRLLERRG